MFFGTGKEIHVATNSSTQVFLDGVASTFANLQNNMGVIVFGNWEPSTNTLTATEVRAYTKGGFGFKNGKGLELGLKMRMGGL